MRKPRFLRSYRPSHIVFGLSLLAVLTRLTLLVVNEPFIEGDTELLVKAHIRAIQGCIHQGRLVGCPDSGVWPLLQHLPGILLSYLGLSPSAILHALAYLSFLSFLGSLLLIFWTLKRLASLPLAITGVLIMIASPLLWYSHSTYGEMAAAFLVLAFAAACLLRARALVVIALFILAGSSKEVAFPFLFLIGLLCLLPDIVTRPIKVRGRVYGLVLGAVLTLLVTVAFNYFRFATLSNPNYLSKLFIVPSLRIQASFFLGIWFSPNGGLLFFWPSFIFLYFSLALVLLLVGLLRRKSIQREDKQHLAWLIHYLPIITISIILFLLTAGFSRWYTPLGGAAWGPRYMLPWIPAVLLLLLYFYREEVETILRLVLSKPIAFVLACVTLIAVTIPQFSILFGPFVLARIFAFSECPRIPIIQESITDYYPCIQTQIWPRTLRILELYRVALKPQALWFTIPCSLVLISGLLLVRRQLFRDGIRVETESKIWPDLDDTVSMLRRAVNTPARHSLTVVAFFSLIFLLFFFPAIYHGHLLALNGDGLYVYLPNFYSRKVLWDTLLFSGFPMTADPQVMTWYPPAAVLSLLPGTWNLFVLMAYVAGSSFTYGYVYALTRSRLAALVGSLVFGLSGFMMAHLVHVVIIHSAAWIPLTVWSLEMLRRQLSTKWLLIGSMSVAMSFLGGHSQIFVYGLLLAAAYAVTFGWSAPAGRWRYYLASFLMVMLGITLAAVQIVPTADLIGQSIRLAYRFQDFVAHALPPRQAVTMIFPMAFGGPPASGTLPYFGPDNQTELTGYVGLLPLMLSAIGLIASGKKPLAVFWLCAALLAFVLAMGDATPLARLLYHVPVLNSFRAPARHFFELTLAASVLSGLGVAAILQQRVSSKLILKVSLLGSLAMLICVVLLFMNTGYMAPLATEKGISQLELLPWANRAVGIPLIIFLLAIGVLTYWYRQPASILRSALLLIVLIVDLGSFGWFFEWRYNSVDKSVLNAPAIAGRYKSYLDAGNQRLMPYRTFRGMTEMAPNLTRLWGVPSASGYNALIFSRVRNQLPMIDFWSTPLPWSEPENKSLDLMAVRYLFLPPNEMATDSYGISWFNDDMKQWLGSGCNQALHSTLKFTLPTPLRSTCLAVVSRLACSTHVPDQAEVARVQLMDDKGNVQTRNLLAGRDSSEWAYDCASVKPQTRHQRANIFSSYPAKMYDEFCEGHFYIAKFFLDGAKEIKSIEFDWLGAPPASMSIEKVSLINDETKTSFPVDSAFVSDRGWRIFEETNRERICENLRAMPRVWLVPEVVSVNPEQALEAIKTGSLPDSRSFDPTRTALVEEPLAATAQNVDSKATASVTELSDTRMEVRTASTAPAFLVTSDAYYPGWRASIDGKGTPLYRADYAIRGVFVPPGEHVVRFEYSPRSFYFGAGISAVSMLVMIATATLLWFRSRLRVSLRSRSIASKSTALP